MLVNKGRVLESGKIAASDCIVQPEKHSQNWPKTLKQHWPFLLVLAFYFTITFNYSFNVPVWEAPDEPAHFAYTHHIRTQGGPPIQSFDEGKNLVETGHHPPLYYYLGVLATLPLNLSDFDRARTNPHFSFSNTDGGVNRFEHANEDKLYPNTLTAVQLIRLISTLFGAGTLLVIYLAGLVLFGGKGWEWALNGRIPALLATTFVATLPQFNFLSGAANNDNAVIFFCAFTLYLCLRLLLLPPVGPGESKGWLFFALVGLAVGLGLLSKYNEVVYIPLVGLSLVVAAWKQRSWGYFLKSSFISGGVCVAVAGWWFLRSQILYGDPAGWDMWRSSFHSIEQTDKFQITGAFLDHTWARWFNSFWGYFGWFNLPLEPETYKWLARLSLVIGLGVTGLVLTLLVGLLLKNRPKFNKIISKVGGYDRRSGLGLLFCGLAIVLVVISAFNYAVTFGDAGTQGRYLFPALAPLALVFSGGLVWLLGLFRLLALPGRFYKVGGGLLVGGWLLGFSWLNLHAVHDIIEPAYQPVAQVRAKVVVPDLPPGAIKLSQKPRFLPAMELEGYAFEPPHRANMKSGKVKVTLYWRAMNQKPLKDNWVGYAQLVDGSQVLDRNDGPPAGGLYQTFKWQPGELIKDERSFNLQDWQLSQINKYNDTLKIYLGWARSPDWSRAKLPDGSDGLTLDWQQ